MLCGFFFEGRMYYKQKFDTFIRVYDDIGYITNKSNFSDRVTDASGTIFLRALSREPKDINVLSKEIASAFLDVQPEQILDDIIDFYGMLEEDGFIVSGETPEQVHSKDTRFSYAELQPKTIKNDFTPTTLRANRDSQDFLQKHFQKNPKLVSFQIELTNECNEQCVHCYIPKNVKKYFIDSHLFYEILEQCKEIGVLEITFSGGEPLLHRNFCDFLRKTKEYDFSINILSNLTLLDNNIIAAIKELRLSSVQVSLYSINNRIHDSITQVQGSCEKTKQSINKLIENNIPLQISCPTMKQNYQRYGEVLEWANKRKVRAITDYIMMARHDNSKDNLASRLSLDEVTTLIKDGILQYDRDYQDDLRKFSAATQSIDVHAPICGVGVSSLCMTAEGNVFPCPGWQCFKVGDVKNDSLLEIWHNSPQIHYLRKLTWGNFPSCTQCNVQQFCAMCLVRNANENQQGDPLIINSHFCDVAKINKKIVSDLMTGNHII